MIGTHFTIIFTHLPEKMKTRPSLDEVETSKKTEKYSGSISEDSESTRISPESMIFKSPGTRKRNRKDKGQLKILVGAYNESPVWDKETILKLVQKTGLNEAVIYKWNWDYKKKTKKVLRGIHISRLMCSEFLMPSRYDSDMVLLQRLYKAKIESIAIISPSKLLFN